MSPSPSPTLESFRREARAWLAANLDRRTATESSLRGRQTITAASVAGARTLQRRIFDAGFAGISWPVEYGGRGLSEEHELAFLEEAQGFVIPDFGVAGLTTMGVCGPTMIAHASPEFLRRHIPAILAGEELWVQLFSEPDAGSDLAGVRTTAARTDGGWVLNGAKIWSSGAYYSDYGMCLARTDWDVPKHAGLTWFAVPLQAAGVTIRPIREINGHGEFCEEFLEDVHLTDDDVIGEVNDGWAVARTMLVLERGAGRRDWRPAGPRRLCPDLVALARRHGREKDPIIRQLIARAHVNDFAQIQLMERVERRTREGDDRSAGFAAIGKLAMGTFQPMRARIGLEVGRGASVVWDPADADGDTAALEYLNSRVMSIAGGTNEVQRNAIGERVLGLPREPTFDGGKSFRDVLRDARSWNGRGSAR